MGNAMEITSSQMAGIGRRMKALRRKLILTQTELGELMGVTKTTVCNVERGNFSRVSIHTLKKLVNLERKVAGEKGSAMLRTVPK